jgi:hypothetical protein
VAEEEASGAAAEESGNRLSACEASLLAAETLVRDKTRDLQTAEARVVELADNQSTLQSELALSHQIQQSLAWIFHTRHESRTGRSAGMVPA